LFCQPGGFKGVPAIQLSDAKKHKNEQLAMLQRFIIARAAATLMPFSFVYDIFGK